MRVDVITLFPELVAQVGSCGVVGRAAEQGDIIEPPVQSCRDVLFGKRHAVNQAASIGQGECHAISAFHRQRCGCGWNAGIRMPGMPALKLKPGVRHHANLLQMGLIALVTEPALAVRRTLFGQ